MTLTNIDLLVDVLAHIELDPNSWDQGSWAALRTPDSYHGDEQPAVTTDCETAFCVAGWACQLSGAEFLWTHVRRNQWRAEHVATSPGAREAVADAAARLLSLDEPNPEFDALFDPLNTMTDLYALSAEHAGLEVEQLQAMVQARVAELSAQASRT